MEYKVGDKILVIDQTHSYVKTRVQTYGIGPHTIIRISNKYVIVKNMTLHRDEVKLYTDSKILRKLLRVRHE